MKKILFFIFYLVALISIESPALAQVAGPDVSSYQSRVNWKKVYSSMVDTRYHTYRIKFAFAKATEGHSIDPQFHRNWKGIKKAGIPTRGAYDFAVFKYNPVTDAKHFVKTVGKVHSGDLLVLDAEGPNHLSQRQMVRWINKWTHTVSRLEKISQHRIVIYTGSWWWGPETGNSLKFKRAGNPLWIANYGQTPRRPIPGWRWTFHQFTDSQHINGISTLTDASTFYRGAHRLYNLSHSR